MSKFLLLLPLLLQSNDKQSIASIVFYDDLVLEIEVTKSVENSRVDGTLDMAVRDVGLGAETVQGTTTTAKYGIGLSGKRPTPGFTPRDGKPIAIGTRMVVAIRKIGTNREPWIMEAWTKGEEKTFEDGRTLIAKLKEVNEAKTEEELSDRVFYTLRKENAASEFLLKRMGLGLRFTRKETLMSLLQRVVECEELPEESRNVLKHSIKVNQPGWAASDERRHEMILAITSSNVPKRIAGVTMDFVEAIRNQKQADVAENWCDNLCGVALEMEERPKEETAAFIEGFNSGIQMQFWRRPLPDQRQILWKTAFRIARESKREEVKNAWQDWLVEQTSQAALFVKKDVLARLDDIKDPTFRERLRNAAHADSTQVDAAPKKP